MMLKKTLPSLILAVLLGLSIIALPAESYAQRYRREGRGDRRSGMGEMRGGRSRVVVRGQEYYYTGGRFYRHGPRGYVIATAPFGARVRVLPPGYATLRIGRAPFYVSFGTYYQYDPAAGVYVVVPPPQGAPPEQNPPPQTSPQAYLDKISLSNGETVTGTYLGGPPDTVQVQVGNDVQSIPVDQINSIQFAPPQQK